MSRSLYPELSERRVLWLVGVVQFINILDFMMVMPLGPDLAQRLGIDLADLGWIGGSYTAASAASGLISALFVDRLSRKTTLLGALCGLMLATFAGGLCWNFSSLLATRILAGIFGGPATSAAWAIVADVVPSERRGQAMGKVMGAFSLAAIFGVPLGLEMAKWHDWRTPFFVTAALGLLIALAGLRLLPPMRAHLAHLAHVRDRVSLSWLFRLAWKPINRLAYAYVAFAMLASFMIVPNISAYLQYNLHYPRAALGRLYGIGGVVSYVTLRATGRLLDRFPASATSLVSNVTFICILWITFVDPSPHLSPFALFLGFMFAMGMRNVSSTTLATRIPPPQERAGFMALLSCVQGCGMATGAFASTHFLHEEAGHALSGMGRLALFSIALSACVPALMRRVERRLAAERPVK
jgi:predicted MFS family arabinose efflux permease